MKRNITCNAISINQPLFPSSSTAITNPLKLEHLGSVSFGPPRQRFHSFDSRWDCWRISFRHRSRCVSYNSSAPHKQLRSISCHLQVNVSKYRIIGPFNPGNYPDIKITSLWLVTKKKNSDYRKSCHTQTLRLVACCW